MLHIGNFNRRRALESSLTNNQWVYKKHCMVSVEGLSSSVNPGRNGARPAEGVHKHTKCLLDETDSRSLQKTTCTSTRCVHELKPDSLKPRNCPGQSDNFELRLWGLRRTETVATMVMVREYLFRRGHTKPHDYQATGSVIPPSRRYRPVVQILKMRAGPFWNLSILTNDKLSVTVTATVTLWVSK